MGAFFVYILKAVACLSVFYLFYRLLLSRETFHRFNRIAVLGILVISLLIPFCEIKVAEQSEVHQTVLSLEQLLLLADMMEGTPVVETQADTVDWIHIVLFVYLAGILFFACRNIYSLIRLYLLIKSGKREKLDGKVSLIVHDKNDLSPFSWMNYVVISSKDLEENGREILIHELAHIRKRHSIDLLIADICIFFQWFNPAAWLLKQELQNIHEYEADDTVIKEGVSAKEYQLLLIKKAVGTRLYSMANSFNHSKLKKRITMMLKEKSSPWARLKYLYVLPLAAVAVSAFARPEISNELKEISEIKVNDLTAIVVANEKESISQSDDSVMLIHGTPVVRHKVDDAEPSYTIAPSVLELSGVASYVAGPAEAKFDTTKPGITDETTLNVGFAENRVSVVGGNMSLKADKIKFSTPQSVVIVNDVKDDEKPLYIIDGKEVTDATLQAINPSHIKSLSVIKDKAAIDLYGEKAANGVILITLLTEEEREKKAKEPEKGLLEIAKDKASPEALVLLDGNILSNIDVINPDMIANITIHEPGNKDDKEGLLLAEKYGDKAIKGIFSIKSKKSDDTKGAVLYVGGVNSIAKTIKMQGQVVDADGEPVTGAAIKVAGSNTGTVSDMEGKFSLEAREIDYITVIYAGMKKAVAKVSPTLTVTLEKE